MKINRYNFAISLFLSAIVLLAAVVAPAQKTGGKNSFAHLRGNHARALRAWLKGKSYLRPAQESDCKNEYGLKAARQNDSDFHPYYAAYDFDKDSIADFAVALVDSRRPASGKFTLVVFKGAANNDFKPFYTREKIDLRQGGLWLNVLAEGVAELHAGEFETDDCFRLAWRGKKLVPVDCAAGEAEN
jgi:hypothetical protein